MSKSGWHRVFPRPLYAAFLIGLLLVAAWGFWPRATVVEVATVGHHPLEVTVIEEGRTRLRDRFVVSAPVDGVVERMTLEVGDAVGNGETVAVMRPAAAALLDPMTRAEASLRVDTARDELVAAEAAAAAARSERSRASAALARIERMAERQQAAAEALDEARHLASAADAALRSATAMVEAARSRRDAAARWLELQGTTSERPVRLALASPIAGRVIRRHVESEGFARTGQPLLEIGDPQALEVMVEVLTADALLLRTGMPVWIDIGDDRPPIKAQVQSIEPAAFTKVSALGVEEQRVIVIVALPTAVSGLGDGYRVDASFQVWAAESTLALPVSALFRDGEDWAAYVVVAGRARLRRLTIGHLGDVLAEVSSGVVTGDRVIVYPGDEIRDGMRVSFATGR